MNELLDILRKHPAWEATIRCRQQDRSWVLVLRDSATGKSKQYWMGDEAFDGNNPLFRLISVSGTIDPETAEQ